MYWHTKFSLFSHHHSLHCQLLFLLTLWNSNYVHITKICTVIYLFYWQSELVIIFTSPQFAHSVTCFFNTSNSSLCSHYHSKHSWLLIVLTLRTSHYVYITTISTVSYLFFWHSQILIIFTSPKLAQSVTFSFWHPELFIMFITPQFAH
jgi:hypothetical protein